MGSCCGGQKIVAGRRVGQPPESVTGASSEVFAEGQEVAEPTEEVVGSPVASGTDASPTRDVGRPARPAPPSEDSLVAGEPLEEYASDGESSLRHPAARLGFSSGSDAEAPRPGVDELLRLPFDAARSRYPRWRDACNHLPAHRLEALRVAWGQGSRDMARSLEKAIRRGDFDVVEAPSAQARGCKPHSEGFTTTDESVATTDTAMVADLASADWRTGSTMDSPMSSERVQPAGPPARSASAAASSRRPDAHAVGAQWGALDDLSLSPEPYSDSEYVSPQGYHQGAYQATRPRWGDF